MVEKAQAFITADGQIFRTEEAAQNHEDTITLLAVTKNVEAVLGCPGSGTLWIETLTKQLCEDRYGDHADLMDRFVSILVRKHDLAWRPYDHAEEAAKASEDEHRIEYSLVKHVVVLDDNGEVPKGGEGPTVYHGLHRSVE
jgi:hypothetical protein